MLVGHGDGLLALQNRLHLAVSFTHPTDDFMFRFDGFGGGELTAWHICPIYGLKFPCRETGIKIASHLGIGNFTHSATEPVADQRSFIDHGLALKVFITGEGQRFADLFQRIERPLLMPLPFSSLPNHGLGLMAEVGSEFAVRGHHLTRGVDLFPVTGGVRSDLGCLFSSAACALQVLTDLLAARARCVKVLLGIALDLRSAAAARRDLVPKLAQSVGQLGLIDGRGKLLRGE